MKLFLKRILFLAVPIFLTLCFTEYAVRTIPNSYKLKGEFLKSNASTIETLILGSSHTFYGVNPEFFSTKTFNASNVSQSPDIDFAILKSYEDVLNSLKTIVIRLSYDTLFEQIKNSGEDWRLSDYRIYTDVDFDYTIKHNSEILSKGTRQTLRTLKNYYVNNQILHSCDSLGWGNDIGEKSQTDLKVAGQKVAKKHTAKSWDLLDDNSKTLEQLMQWCKNRNIKVILITPPAYESYTENLDEKQLHKMIEVGKELNKNYSNCTYYNFLSDKRFTYEDFYDADHLNAKGAEKFSILINSLIEN